MSVTDRHLPHARRLLAVAALAFLALPAQAMNVSQLGLGQVLLFPYYTVRNGYDTLLSVTNTSASTVVARVRFREALNGREVAAFNVVLAAFDVWTGAATSNAAGDGAVIRTYDRTCTAPFFPVSAGVTGRELAFHNLAYTGSASDGASQSLDRVREGYVEVIAMAGFMSEDSRVPVLALDGFHGLPADCHSVAAAGAPDYDPTLLNPPRNVLAGAATLIHVANGIALDVPVTHIEGFSDQKPIWFPPDSPHPDLADGDAAEAAAYFDDGATFSDPIPTNSADTISALLMTDLIINEFVADGLGAMTSWVVTFPTKRHYVDRPTAVPPFTDIFGDDGTACEYYGNPIFDREQGTVMPFGTSPSPQVHSKFLCHTVDVLDVGGYPLLGDGTNHLVLKNALSRTDGVLPFFAPAGWAPLTLMGSAQGIGTAKAPVSRGGTGLPAIGFAAIVRNNASEAGNNRNYGSTIPHRHVRN